MVKLHFANKSEVLTENDNFSLSGRGLGEKSVILQKVSFCK